MTRLTVGLTALAITAGASAGELGFGSVARGSAGADAAMGGFATMDDSFESLPVLPASLQNTNSDVVWGGIASGLTGRPLLLTLAPPFVGAVADQVSGNATKKLRLQANAGSPTGQWIRYDLAQRNIANGAIVKRLTFRPSAANPLRIATDVYVNSVATRWVVRPAHVADQPDPTSGFLIAALLWGGTNDETGVGLPIGPVEHFYNISPDGFPKNNIWDPCRFIGSAPAGSSVGDMVPPPIGSWFRVIVEVDLAHDSRILIDYDLDGPGPEYALYTGPVIGPSYKVTRIGFAGGNNVAGDAMYLDNLHVQGTPERCIGDANLDDEVNFADLNIVLSQFGQSGPALNGDVDVNGAVNFADLNNVLSQFGRACLIDF